MSHKINEAKLKTELEKLGWNFHTSQKAWIPNWGVARDTADALKQYQAACLASIECSHESTVDKPNIVLATSETEVADGQVGSSEGTEKGSEALTTGHYAPRRGDGNGLYYIREHVPVGNQTQAQEDVNGSTGQDLSRTEG